MAWRDWTDSNRIYSTGKKESPEERIAREEEFEKEIRTIPEGFIWIVFKGQRMPNISSAKRYIGKKVLIYGPTRINCKVNSRQIESSLIYGTLGSIVKEGIVLNAPFIIWYESVVGRIPFPFDLKTRPFLRDLFQNNINNPPNWSAFHNKQCKIPFESLPRQWFDYVVLFSEEINDQSFLVGKHYEVFLANGQKYTGRVKDASKYSMNFSAERFIGSREIKINYSDIIGFMLC